MKIKKFNELSRIPLVDLIEEIRKNDPEVDLDMKNPKSDIRSIVTTYITDDFLFPDVQQDWEKSESFPYKRIDINSVSDDKKKTTSVIFERKSDGKFFKLEVNISHFGIGPDIIELPDFLYEVFPEKITMTKWK